MLPDEVLMAYADGQLDAAGRAQVKELVRQDPEASARLEIFQATGRDLASVFGEHMNSPLPEKLGRLALYAQPLPANTRNSTLGQFAAALRNFARPRPFGLAAASALLMVGIGVGWFLRDAGEGNSPMSGLGLVQVESDGRTVARGPLNVALNSLPSNKETLVRLAAGKVLRVAIKLSFRNHEKDYCRQYEAGLTGSENSGGIACHLGGEWRIKLQAQLGSVRPSAGRTAPAGAKGLALQEAVMSLIDGEALDKQDEDAMILRGWKRR